MKENSFETFEEVEGKSLVLSPVNSFEDSDRESRYTTPMLETEEELNQAMKDQVLIEEGSSEEGSSEESSSEGESSDEEESSDQEENNVPNQEEKSEDSIEIIAEENNEYTNQEKLENILESEQELEEENEEEYEEVDIDSSSAIELVLSDSETNNSNEFIHVKKSVPIEFKSYEPAHPSYHNLKSFTLNVTNEDRKKRNQKLSETGIFFTEEAYKVYALFKPDPIDPEVSILFQGTERNSKKRSLETEQTSDENDQLNTEQVERMDIEETDTDNSKITDVDQTNTESISETTQAVEENSNTIVETPPRKKLKITGPTVLDTVLTDMLRYNRSQATTQEPSDLEIAAMAAGLEFSNQNTSLHYSKFSKDQHIKFLHISEQLKSGSNSVPEADIEIYKRMCIDLKQEQDNFIKEQRKKLCDSGVYNILDEKIEKMVHEYYENENARLLQYPQFYKYFNLLHMPIQNSSTDSPILTFKNSLLQTGTIAPCKSSGMETPRRLDLFKNYITSPSKENDKDENHYKSKLPDTVSMDENIKQLIETNETDIVISSDCLISLIELVHDISLDLYIPIKVVLKNNKKTLIFDRPLPKEEMTAREKNKLIYDVAFKSLCLDWPNRRNVSSIPEEKVNKEENLQYNMWKFGDINILIRHQIDGELIDHANKKLGSKDRRVYLTSKLDYQISQGREEITTANERSTNWLKSYIGGHAAVIEGRIDAVNNRLVRVDVKEMVDIMGSQWRPMLESELLRYTFSQLHKMLLEPGNYLLKHKKDDRNFLIFQGTDTSSDLDLSVKRKDPILIKSDKSFIPAWSAIENQIPWTFPPK